ncbi:hypothetical protein [Phocaeicola sp.]
MENEKFNILDLFLVKRLKNGEIRVKCKITMEHKKRICSILNVYHYIIGEKKYFFMMNNANIKMINSSNILENYMLNYIKNNISLYNSDNYRLYLNAVMAVSIHISKKDMALYCPYLELNEEEKHSLYMLIDSTYKKEYLKNELLQKITDWGFKRVDGLLSRESAYNGLFYRRINDDEYLVFSYASNMPKLHLYIFDFWKCVYKEEKEIGIKSPISIKQIILGVELKRDLDKIETILSELK